MAGRSGPANRMTLLARRGQVRLALDGASLLRGKREALLRELLARARELKEARAALHERGRAAMASLALARAVGGTPAVRSAALAGAREVKVPVTAKKVWGLSLHKAVPRGIVRSRGRRGVGGLDTPSHTSEAAEAGERVVEQLVRCAPLEANLNVLAQEVQAVNRRINALEEQVVPELQEDIRRIEQTLEEREREERFRLKRLKASRRTRE